MKLHSQKTFKCNFCDYKTAVKGSLQRHKLGHATKVECLICKKKVTSLQNHIRVHKPKGSCPICKKMIIQHHLPQHMKKHTRAHKCGNCEENFDDREALRRWVTKCSSFSFDDWLLILDTTWPTTMRDSSSSAIADRCSNLKSYWKIINSITKRSKFVMFVKSRFPHQILCILIGQENIWRRMGSFKSPKVSFQIDYIVPSANVRFLLTARVLNRTGPFICDKCESVCSSRTTFRKHQFRYKIIFNRFCL